MSLDYDLTRVDHESTWWKDQPTEERDAKITAIIHLTMIVGMGEITEGNAEEFFTRVSAYETLGSMLRDHDTERDVLVDAPLTLADIRALIGLHTNVFPKTTDAKFQKFIGQVSMDRAKGRMRLQREELAKVDQEPDAVPAA